jgi:hypothetical protein
MTATVAQSLRPYPQFGTIKSMWAPLGNSWYDALQVTLTKRLSRGIDASVAYTWPKNLANTYEEGGSSIFINDPFNRANAKSFTPYDQPKVLAGIRLPGAGCSPGRKPPAAPRGQQLVGARRHALCRRIADPVAYCSKLSQ